jgi:hypothetical protein
MPSDADEILILEAPIAAEKLRDLVQAGFGDMVKYVVDVRRRVVAIGGGLHADEEQLLLDAGSLQEDLWGANYYPGRGAEGCIEYTSLINIRPAQGNRTMEALDSAVREQIREITFVLIGRGEVV